jgi:hypothetical protein
LLALSLVFPSRSPVHVLALEGLVGLRLPPSAPPQGGFGQVRGACIASRRRRVRSCPSRSPLAAPSPWPLCFDSVSRSSHP